MENKTVLFNYFYCKCFIEGVSDDEAKILIDKMIYLLDNFQLDVSNFQIDVLMLAKEELF